MKRSNALVAWVVTTGVAALVVAGPAAARGPGGGNAGGAVRGLDRAEQVAAPQGERGIDNAERRINRKHNVKNPNTETQEDTDKTTTKKPSSKKK